MQKYIGGNAIALVAALTTGCASTPERAVPETAAPAVAEEPLVFSFAPGNARYRLSLNRVTNTEIQGQTTNVVTTVQLEITAEMIEDSAGRRVTFVVDTVLAAEGAGFANPNSLAGTTYTSSIAPNGRLDGFAVVPTAPLDQLVVNSLSEFYPIIPDSGVSASIQWADTTTSTRPNAGAQITFTAILVNEAGNWIADSSNVRHLEVDWVSTYTLTGTGEQMGQAFTIEGTGRAVGEHLFTENGTYRGTFSADTMTSQVHLTAIGMSIPVQQVSADTVTILP